MRPELLRVGGSPESGEMEVWWVPTYLHGPSPATCSVLSYHLLSRPSTLPALLMMISVRKKW